MCVCVLRHSTLVNPGYDFVYIIYNRTCQCGHLYIAANMPIKTKYKSPYIHVYIIPNWILRPLVH